MEKYCGNCNAAKGCFYRGIQNPCINWEKSPMHAELRKMAKRILGKPMSFTEGQFVESAVTLELFSPKQAGWLRSIAARMGD